MKVLFIGRFQPFHLGHLKVIQHYSPISEKIIIGIGSSQYSHSSDNPFTAEEREQMIVSSLTTHNITNYQIVLIPDIHNYPQWVDHVLSIVTDFTIVIANNSITKRLFEEKGYKVLSPPEYNRKLYSGKEIRRRMRNDLPWKDFVPPQVTQIVETVGGVQRLKYLKKS
jgi:nicotinamide-nucleotide adenylyltransferase